MSLVSHKSLTGSGGDGNDSGGITLISSRPINTGYGGKRGGLYLKSLKIIARVDNDSGGAKNQALGLSTTHLTHSFNLMAVLIYINNNFDFDREIAVCDKSGFHQQRHGRHGRGV